ncbi:MAG: hypothetical protein C4583_11070 [Anaerolineaceae bacterium]|nr:MAG: hypothetical protein C4583_11070 [Anaerolineaceae bacterium]
MTNEDQLDDLKKDNDAGISLIETITSSDLSDLLQDYGEIALDSVVSDGILKEIPVINSIVGVAKIAISIRDKLLVKKLAHFLHELSDTTEKERMNFLQEFEEDPKEQRKIGENLLLLLDRLDNMDKPAMVAKLLKAYIKGEIDSFDDFTFYSSIIDKSPISELSSLFTYFSMLDADEDSLGKRFHHLGLSFMTVTINPKFLPEPEDVIDRMHYKQEQRITPTNKATVKYKLSERAYKLAKIILGDQCGNKELFFDYL